MDTRALWDAPLPVVKIVVLWTGGRVADVSFSVSPAPGDTATQVGHRLMPLAILALAVLVAWGPLRHSVPS